MKVLRTQLASERVVSAMEHLHCCRLCPRDCRVNRQQGEIGFCGLDGRAWWFREALVWTEEPPLIPSHQIYFSGCNLRCEYCTVDEWNREPRAGKLFDTAELVKIIRQRHQEGARTLNLLGGEPAVNIAGILELLGQVEPETRVVWNSNMYYQLVVGEWLEGLIDVYLADFKCGNAACAEKILGARDYMEVLKRNLKAIDREASVIVRHVLLPGHQECCLIPILEWLAEYLPFARLSLWKEYAPPMESKWAPQGYVTQPEWEKAREKAEQYGLKFAV